MSVLITEGVGMTRAWAVPFVTNALTQVAVIATSIYLHRALGHPSLKLHPLADLTFPAALWLTTEHAGKQGSRPITSTTPSWTMTVIHTVPGLGLQASSVVQCRLLPPRGAQRADPRDVAPETPA